MKGFRIDTNENSNRYGKYNIEDKENYRSIFTVISGAYYHENYHSDILSYYLEFNDAKSSFIKWVNNLKNDKNKIIFQDYINGKILREKRKIDILLLNNNETKGIIIENKSNNAVDQADQIYRYYKEISEEKLEVEAIVYLNKNALKLPKLSEEKLAEINNILVKAQLVGQNNSFEDVLNDVIRTTENIRLNALSCEIKNLFL